MARTFRRDEQGSSAVIPWMVAAIVFSSSFYFVSDTVRDNPRDLGAQEARTLSVGATSLVDVLLDPGSGWTDPAACTGDATQETTTFTTDTSTRLGLGVESCETTQIDSTGNLSYEKLENLYVGETEADPENGVVDYEEARESLDLDEEGLDFHLRTWPNLPAAETVLQPGGQKAPIRPVYLADYEPLEGDAGDDDKGKGKKDAAGYAPSAAAQDEVRLIAALGRTFDAATEADDHDHAAIPNANKGDVVPDAALHVEQLLLPRLVDQDGDATIDDITTLVIGSGADAASLDSLATRHAIADWVHAGGTLIVLSTPSLEPEWLRPLLAGGVPTASGSIRNPDPGHPSLHSPNPLDHAFYRVPDAPQPYSAAVRELFIHVAVSDFGDLLAVSNPGAFGLGRIVMTAWSPAELTNDQAQRCPTDLGQSEVCEPLYLLHNLLSITLKELYLDYGPQAPDSYPGGEERRLAYTYHPGLRETFSLSVELHLFPRETEA